MYVDVRSARAASIVDVLFSRARLENDGIAANRLAGEEVGANRNQLYADFFSGDWDTEHGRVSG